MAIIKAEPYVPEKSEIKNKWIQTAEGVYVAPQLVTDVNGDTKVGIKWHEAISAAYALRGIHDMNLQVTSWLEEIEAIKKNAKTKEEAERISAWTRNMYETTNAAGRVLTRSLAYCNGLSGPSDFVDHGDVLRDGYVSGINKLGAPEFTDIHTPNSDFLDAMLSYGNGPVIRGCNFSAVVARPADVFEDVGFRLSYHEDLKEEEISALKQLLTESRDVLVRTESSLS